MDSFSDLSWSPDSAYLAFDQTPIQGNSKSEAWLADIRSGQLTKIIDGVITPSLLP